MFGLGFGEILIILVVALIFIGPKKLPELAKSIGKGLREFQRTKNEIMDDINSPPPQPPVEQSTKISHQEVLDKEDDKPLK